MEKTEGHVQFNGTHFQFYPVKQAGMRCETPDCSTCKKKSEEYDAKLTAEDRKRIEEDKKAEEARIKVKAEESRIIEEKRVADKAAGLKGDAVRIVAIQKVEMTAELEKACGEKIAKAEEACRLAIEEARKSLEAGKANAEEMQTKRLIDIEKSDWVALARVPGIVQEPVKE